MRLAIALIIALGFAGVYLYYSPQAQKRAEEAAQKEQATKDFVYKIDPRRFDQNPNPVAISEKWTNDKDVMVLIQPKTSKLKPFYIDAYEAVISNYRAWSVPGQMPTDKLRPVDAQVACQAAGKRLCKYYEWQTACRGGEIQKKPFTNATTLMKTCDFARSNTYDKNDYVNKTDSHPNCTPHGAPIHHMLGNVSEFVEDQSGRVMIVGLTYYDGKMRDKPTAMRNGCERIVAGGGQYPAERFNKGLGFRCCKDAQ